MRDYLSLQNYIGILLVLVYLCKIDRQAFVVQVQSKAPVIRRCKRGSYSQDANYGFL